MGLIIMVGTVLFMSPMRIENAAHVMDEVVEDGWGTGCGFGLLLVNECFLLVWLCGCSLTWLGPAPSRRRAFCLLHGGAHKEGA